MLCFPKINNPCPKGYPNAKCVVYTGSNLECSGISTNDRLDTILEKIDEKLCSAVPGEIFLEAGSNISISGDGSEDDPYIISFTGSFENPLTFSTGLTRTSNTVTANLSTGISGGQSVIGGTQAGNDLTLSSTSHSTKGNLFFGNSTYDEVNNRLGIGTVAPTTLFSIEEKIRMYTNAAGGITSAIEASNGNTLLLAGGRGNLASGVEIIPNIYGSTPNFRFKEDASGNNVFMTLVNSGAVEQLAIGIDNTTDEVYFQPINDALTAAIYRELRLDAYPDTREDGLTSKALYIDDATGKVVYGTISGAGGTAIAQTLFSGDNTTQVFNIPHGLAGVPKFLAISASDDAQGATFTADSTNIIVTYAVAPPTGTDNVIINWSANL